MSNLQVPIPNHLIGEGAYVVNDNRYDMTSLLDAIKGLEVFDLQLIGIDLSVKPWNINHLYGMIYHMNRVNNADLTYPIILDPFGYIIDGWHRVVKAILNGDTTVKAVRLLVMPEPDNIK